MPCGAGQNALPTWELSSCSAMAEPDWRAPAMTKKETDCNISTYDTNAIGKSEGKWCAWSLWTIKILPAWTCKHSPELERSNWEDWGDSTVFGNHWKGREKGLSPSLTKLNGSCRAKSRDELELIWVFLSIHSWFWLCHPGNCQERRNSLDYHTLERGITFPGMGRLFSHYQPGICSQIGCPSWPHTGLFLPRMSDLFRPTPAGLSVWYPYKAEVPNAAMGSGRHKLKTWHCPLKSCFTDQGSWEYSGRDASSTLDFFTLLEYLKTLFLTTSSMQFRNFLNPPFMKFCWVLCLVYA